MNRVYALGETLYDITFKDGKPLTAWPGGSLLNTCVSLRRLGVPVSFISEYGQDAVGNIIHRFLEKNSIETRFINRYKHFNTTISLAFLNKQNEAGYSFYKNYPAQRLQVDLPVFSSNDFFLFGSFFALNKAIRPKLLGMLREANKKNVFVLYDPNFRKGHLSALPSVRKSILQNMSMATLVRGSNEDFRNIFGAGDADEAYRAISRHVKYLIYTASNRAVYLYTPELSLQISVPKVVTKSTIGAGDTFNAGIIYELYRRGTGPDDLPNLGKTEWTAILQTGVTLAGEVCRHYENYISMDFARDFIKRKSS